MLLQAGAKVDLWTEVNNAEALAITFLRIFSPSFYSDSTVIAVASTWPFSLCTARESSENMHDNSCTAAQICSTMPTKNMLDVLLELGTPNHKKQKLIVNGVCYIQRGSTALTKFLHCTALQCNYT